MMDDSVDYYIYCPFPKHRYTPWEDVVVEDRQYVEWLVGGEGPELVPGLEERLVSLLESIEH